MALSLASGYRALGPPTRPAAPTFDYSAQPKQTLEACNLCAGKSWVVIEHRDRYGFDIQANYCTGCGLVFLSPLMTREAYSQFYRGTYRQLVGTSPDGLRSAQAGYARRLGAFLAPFVPKAARTLLDIGGSTGIVAEHLASQFKLEAAVLDPAAQELEQTSLERLPMMFEDYQPEGRTFDVITLCQTADHLSDLSGALASIWAMLSARGIFYVDIVDFRGEYLRHGVEKALKIDHPLYLTEATMERYLRLRKFRVLRKVYAADHRHIGYVCERTEIPAVGSWNHDATRELAEIREIQTGGPRWQR